MWHSELRAVHQRTGCRSGDAKPFYRAELRTLNTRISAALAKTTDHETRAHPEGAHDQIGRILDPKFNQTGGAATPVIRAGPANSINRSVAGRTMSYSRIDVPGYVPGLATT